MIHSRAGVWPGKNHKYFIKRKLNIEFEISFFFKFIHSKIHSDIKMLYNFVIMICIKYLAKKRYVFFQNNDMYSNSKCTGAYFCLLI